MNGPPAVLRGQLSAFRAGGLRAVDHRWVTSAEIYDRNKSPGARSTRMNRRAESHEDHYIESLLRIRQVTANLTVPPVRAELRESDIPMVIAADIARDWELPQSRHTMECFLLANASDVEIADELVLNDPAVVTNYHAAFFDVRARLKNPHLIADLVFAPFYSQGGLDAAGVQKLAAWMFGAESYSSFKLAKPDEQLEELTAVFNTVLRRNQELAATLRRRLGFESIEAISMHVSDRSAIALKAKLQVDKTSVVDKGTAGVINGLSKITQAAGGLQIADETSKVAPRVEAVKISMTL